MIADALFLVFVAFTLVGGFLAVSVRNVFYNALALIVSLFGVAGLFVFLNAEFLAVMEVTIYIGAIAVAIIFAIMLSRPMQQQKEPLELSKISRSAVIALFLFLGLLRVLKAARWNQPGAEGDASLAALGRSLLGVHAVPFEVVSLVLLIAIIGALVISTEKGPRA